MGELFASLFTSGRVVDLILLVVVVEILALVLWPRLRGRMSLADVAGLIAPGVMLLLALRCALTGAPHTITAAILAAAFVFHLWDVIRRRRGAA
ncbi:MAG: hypothetical protein GC187_12920 [Alphaproteobacteria bacterium]|nr:hypothetical protein [Alphaproteobacteria bacterium]